MADATEKSSCPTAHLSALLETIKHQDDGLAAVEALLREFGEDARLHFLKGSLLAQAQRYGDARQAFLTAVHLAPNDALARFQLGFLELTSGDTAAAAVTWRPLEGPASDPALRFFIRGLQRLNRNDHLGAIELLTKGLGSNSAYPAINGNIQIILDRLRDIVRGAGEQTSRPTPVSATHLLLRNYGPDEITH